MTSLSESIRECDSFVGSIFLTRSLLSHPSLMSQRIDDLVRYLRIDITVSQSEQQVRHGYELSRTDRSRAKKLKKIEKK